MLQVFPDWQSVESWGIPIPGKLSKLANDAMRVVYFLGPVINFAVLQAIAQSYGALLMSLSAIEPC